MSDKSTDEDEIEASRMPLLDHLIERAKGRPVSEDELEKVKSQLAHTLRSVLVRG